MQPYANISGNSGVKAYVIADSFIDIRYRDGGEYRYDFRRPGRKHVLAMIQLAGKGKGLSTYINQYVRDNYARKLR